ncbi:MAG: adenine phosphoribosyltransferase [Defluviitaleaceae bacterium]|nr:adenine phosphoribosyltransferase [Defluviitaleaceae bacterium]
MDLRSAIRDIPDFPEKGILFRDITPVLQDAELLRAALDQIAELAVKYEFDVVAGPESRGFLFGVPLAVRLGKGFVPIRKIGKLPYTTVKKSYDLEYGSATIEMHTDAVKPGQKVLVVDDLLATGGTARAIVELIEEAGAEVTASLFLIELSALEGRKALKGDIEAVITY